MTTIQTNRCKAIIAINISAIFTVSLISVTKVACNEKGLNSFDIVVFANLMSLICSTIFSYFTGKSFNIEKDLRWTLFFRALAGFIALVSLTLGAALIPISVQLTVGNMAPFFASLFAFMTIGEKMSTFEIIMMFMSFGAVVMVALS